MQTEAGSESVADVLRAARKLIEKPEAWTQGVYAKDADGSAVPSTHHSAVCFCSAGALFHAASGEALRAAHSALSKVVRRRAVTKWNDAKRRTHAEVLAAFDAAIAKAEEAQ